jgi:hypothetical protein
MIAIRAIVLLNYVQIFTVRTSRVIKPTSGIESVRFGNEGLFIDPFAG